MEMVNVMDVNLVLILIGAALAFGWGFVYFSERVAGKAFMEINGTKSDAPMLVPMALEALYLLLLSWLVAVFYMLQMDHGMVRGIGAIFSATVIIGHFSAAAWSQRPMMLAGLNSGYFVGVIVILLLTNYVSRMMAG